MHALYVEADGNAAPVHGSAKSERDLVSADPQKDVEVTLCKAAGGTWPRAGSVARHSAAEASSQRASSITSAFTCDPAPRTPLWPLAQPLRPRELGPGGECAGAASAAKPVVAGFLRCGILGG